MYSFFDMQKQLWHDRHGIRTSILFIGGVVVPQTLQENVVEQTCERDSSAANI